MASYGPFVCFMLIPVRKYSQYFYNILNHMQNTGHSMHCVKISPSIIIVLTGFGTFMSIMQSILMDKNVLTMLS